MRKLIIAGTATLGLLGAWVASASTNDVQPQGHAYFSLPFGGSSKAVKEPLHYGFRFDYDARTRASYDRNVQVDFDTRRAFADSRLTPALAQFDFDTRGNSLALVGGVPFAGRVSPVQRQNEGSSSTPEGGSSGFSFFDWTLLAVGIGGVGYAIYKISESKDSPDPAPATGGGTGPVCTLLPALCPKTLTGNYSQLPAEQADAEHLNWLAEHNGQMGDLGAAQP